MSTDLCGTHHVEYRTLIIGENKWEDRLTKNGLDK